MINTNNYTILDDLNVAVNITDNKYKLPLHSLTSLAAKEDKNDVKYICASKVLGRFSPVNPEITLLLGALLGNELSKHKYLNDVLDRIVESIKHPNDEIYKIKNLLKYIYNNKLEIDTPTVFIGVSENGISLGHSIFNVFNRDCYYIHTTNEELVNRMSVIKFNNKDSEFLYLKNRDIFSKCKRVVIVDEELTLKSLNIIREINKICGIEEYICISLFDWRDKKEMLDYLQLEKELGITINSMSLIKGSIKEIISSKDFRADNNHQLYNKHSDTKVRVCNIPINNLYYEKLNNCNINKEHLVKGTGRFGISTEDNKVCIDELVNKVKKYNLKIEDNTLVMGFGEFIFLPMFMTAKLGKNIKYVSPSLLKIHTSKEEDYPFNNCDVIQCPYDTNKYYYMYNIDNNYENIILFLERKPTDKFVNYFKEIAARRGVEQVDIFHF